jgi:hypothetical protein
MIAIKIAVNQQQGVQQVSGDGEFNACPRGTSHETQSRRRMIPSTPIRAAGRA